MDDLFSSEDTIEEVDEIIDDSDKLLQKYDFIIKAWQVSYEMHPRSNSNKPSLKGTDELIKVLGQAWSPKLDCLKFQTIA